jgi:hypothetical protein
MKFALARIQKQCPGTDTDVSEMLLQYRKEQRKEREHDSERNSAEPRRTILASMASDVTTRCLWWSGMEYVAYLPMMFSSSTEARLDTRYQIYQQVRASILLSK